MVDRRSDCPLALRSTRAVQTLKLFKATMVTAVKEKILGNEEILSDFFGLQL